MRCLGRRILSRVITFAKTTAERLADFLTYHCRLLALVREGRERLKYRQTLSLPRRAAKTRFRILSIGRTA